MMMKKLMIITTSNLPDIDELAEIGVGFDEGWFSLIENLAHA